MFLHDHFLKWAANVAEAERELYSSEEHDEEEEEDEKDEEDEEDYVQKCRYNQKSRIG
jgi:hypothetical protein